jgi:membrane-associated tyrosine/threonine-specific cdc2-inhibitory kinase
MLNSTLSPDPKAFMDSFDLRKKTPRSDRGIPCPPTPARVKGPHRLTRASSLAETKILLSFGMDKDDTPQFNSRYKDQFPIGEGSSCEVYRAVRLDTGEDVAIKRYKRPFRGENERASFVRGGALVKELGIHPHIIRYNKCWQENMHFYIEMELCPRNLTEHVVNMERRGEEISSSLIAFWGIQLAKALNLLHNNNVLHLDLKPDNVLVTESGMLKLGDFGQARKLSDVSDGSEGDSKYMAAELLRTSEDGTRRNRHSNGNENSLTRSLTGIGSLDFENFEKPIFPSSVEKQKLEVQESQDKPLPLLNNSMDSESIMTLHFDEMGNGDDSDWCVQPGTDIFSLGLLCFELATNSELPTEGRHWQQLRRGGARPYLENRVENELKEIILEMLAVRPTSRPSAAELIERFYPLLTPHQCELLNEFDASISAANTPIQRYS